MAYTQVNTYHSDKQESKTPDQQYKVVHGGKYITDGRQDHNIGYEAPEMMVIHSRQKSRGGKLRTKSGCISCKLGRLGLDQ